MLGAKSIEAIDNLTTEQTFGLSSWQKALEEHFAHLHQSRSIILRDTPVFALEHGLGELELTDLKTAVRVEISRGQPSSECWLPWAIYATELGYQYSGHEYWQTFEAITPGWTQNSHRDWLRYCFAQFHQKFRGAEPTGAWAEHFSIICWPIVHAILPQDLQLQLAKTLYELRHAFRQEHFDSPKLLGELIAAHNRKTSSRFRNFIQEPLLVGQIASALLFHGEQSAAPLILPDTLARIARDLEKESRARKWLRDAKMTAQGVRLKGLRSIGSGARTASSSAKEVREQYATWAIEPRILLRSVSPIEWDVVLQIPDLSPLLSHFPPFATAIRDSRCHVAGAADRSALARGRLTYGCQQVRLGTWPKSDEVLLRFEKSTPELDFCLRTECLLYPGPKWLFRVGADVIATEVRSLTVRPSNTYILLGPQDEAPKGIQHEELILRCTGISGYRFHTPNTISSSLKSAIEQAGLRTARSIELWPVGTPAAAWDGEGRIEWLLDDHPIVGIRVDHEIEGLSLWFAGVDNNKLELPPAISGAPQFVKLPALGLGEHVFYVGTHSSKPDRGELRITVREPRRTSYSGANLVGPLMLMSDPTNRIITMGLHGQQLSLNQ